MRPAVIYHARCSDGFAAAFAVWLRLGDDADYWPLVHADTVPDVTGREVVMVDIAFDLDQMERIARQATRLTLLDHHQTAADALRCFHCGRGHVLFDMSKSAARLAWEHFHPGQPIPDLLAHVEDRDLLQWALADSADFLASLDRGPHHFRRWSGVMGMTAEARERFLERGRVLRDQSRRLAEDLAAHCCPVTVCGERGLMANAPDLMHNLVGELLLARGCSYALLWCIEGQGSRVKVGLRGAPGHDTTRIAKAFGGGGHPYASAFRLPIESLGRLVGGGLEPSLP